jgi:hypothetical protein
MSLINDALKRASQSDKNRRAQAPLPLPMQPVPVPPRNGNFSPLLIAVIVIAVLGLAVSGWLYFSPQNPPHPIATTVPAPPAQKAVAESPAPKPAPEIQKISLPPAAPAPAQVRANAPMPVLTSPVAPPETFPTNLTLKAIFYNKTNPRALVNGQTVGPGDKIGDVLVTGILSDRIFLDWKGQSQVLMMGGQ